MKFDENVNDLLKKYPLNEDLGNIFGTLGQMVKNKMKYILEPMTKPFDEAKPDLSKGDDIIIKVADSLIADPNNSNKKIKFVKDGNPLTPVSYADIIKFERNSGASNRPEQIAKQIIKVVDLNDAKQRLNVDNPSISEKIKEVLEKEKKRREEYGEEQTRADISVDRLVQRYKYLIKSYFKPFTSKQDEKQKWLYILANNNQEIKFSGDLSTTTPSTSGAGTPAPTGTTTPSPSGAGTSAPAPARTRTPITRRQRTP
jgi:hypothetical protein